ncbi:MAG TPA: helix-turn-helix domain-containing protein [Gammaproteobacteria bacterium]|jgi:AraC-like DNA-binding protein|nr:helix-turn-helix domain-containing protein [Gammaproteobacteria bacterium]
MPKVFSTARVVRGAQLKYWNDLHSGLLTPLEIKPFDRSTFEATSSFEQLGPLRLVRTRSAPAVVEHRARHVALTKERRFRILLPTHGRIRVQHVGREALLQEGDFVMLDDSAPYRIAFRERNQALCVAVSPTMLRTYLPTPANLCGLPMAAGNPMNGIVGAMLRGLWAQIERGLPAEQGATLAKTLLQSIAAAYAIEHSVEVERPVVTAARYAEIKNYIEMHLRSPDLGPTPIANALGLSRRYIRLLFAANDDSVTAYIRRRRLEECAFELSQPLWRGRSITATAADWGFRSMAHFARSFKNQYGTTPTAYRRARLRPART